MFSNQNMAKIVEEVLEFMKLRTQEIRALPEAALAACVQIEGFHMTCTIHFVEPFRFLLSHISFVPGLASCHAKYFFIPDFGLVRFPLKRPGNFTIRNSNNWSVKSSDGFGNFLNSLTQRRRQWTV
jgi:hypothetical protein